MPFVLAGLFLLLAGSASAASPWPPSAKLRAQALVAQMTLAEKLSLCMGSEQGTYAGTLPAIPRLGIPEFTLEDGPQGVGDGMSGVTAFPTALTVAQSWDPALLQSFGAAVGLEHFLKGTNVMLGPGTNLARNPFNGRLWEYYSESEVLSAAAVAAFVTGAQSNNVSTCVKHFLCNSQEFNRNSEDAVVGQRPLRELYAHAYRAAAAAGAGSFMLGVNKVNGLENSASPETLDILFNDGFEGWFVVSAAAQAEQPHGPHSPCSHSHPPPHTHKPHACDRRTGLASWCPMPLLQPWLAPAWRCPAATSTSTSLPSLPMARCQWL